MTQLFQLTIDSVATEIAKCTISEEMNRMYDVATFTMTTEPQHELDVIINYGSKTFNGFVYSTKKISKDLFQVECRTGGAKLTEPYSAYTEGFDDATTSHELCALYATDSGISITNTAGNLDFGGSYERTGTMLSALQNIANVTGAEYWDDGSGIQIQPNKAITTEGTEIDPQDIFDFVQTKSSVYNKGVGFITIRNGGSETNDIISNNKIYGEIDECTGEIFIYTNPYGAVEHTVGLSPLTAILIDRTETNSMIDDDIVTLDGAIDSITSITLNGVNVTDYNFEQGHNVIYFSTLQRGTLTVTYTAKAYRGYVNITAVPIGRFITFDIFYLDQIVKFEGLLSPDCSSTLATDGDMVCIVPNEMNYNQGFNVWTIGGDPEILFYDKSDQIFRRVVSTNDSYIAVENATLEATVSGYRYETRYPIDTALDAQSFGEDISYTTSVDGDDHYFEFTEYYPSIQVSYETDAEKHYVQFTEIPNGEITMLIRNNNTGEICSYQLDYKIPCELNQYITVHIASELGIPVADAAGEVLSYTKPSLATSNVTVDNFGNVKIYVTQDGDYVIDTDDLKIRTTVTLTANTGA